MAKSQPARPLTDADLHAAVGGWSFGDNQPGGSSGADTLAGTGFMASIAGGGGDDLVTSDARFSFLEGNAGNDTLRGGAGTDELGGGEGADLLLGGAGSDLLDGGDGAADTLDGGDGTDRVYWQPGGGNDLLIGGGEAAGTGGDMLDVSRGMGFEAFKAAYHPSGGAVTLAVDAIGNVTAFDAAGRQVGFSGELRVGGEVVRIDGFERVFVNVAPPVQGVEIDTDQLGGQPDTVEGTRGDDVIHWVPSSGNDVIDGMGGADTLDISRELTFEDLKAGFQHLDRGVTLSVDANGLVSAFNQFGERVSFEGSFSAGGSTVALNGIAFVRVQM